MTSKAKVKNDLGYKQRQRETDWTATEREREINRKIEQMVNKYIEKIEE